VVGRAVSISRSKEVNLNGRSNDGILITDRGVLLTICYFISNFQTFNILNKWSDGDDDDPLSFTVFSPLQ